MVEWWFYLLENSVNMNLIQKYGSLKIFLNFLNRAYFKVYSQLKYLKWLRFRRAYWPQESQKFGKFFAAYFKDL